MKPNFRTLISASAVSLLASTAFAQDKTYPKPDRAESAHQRMAHPQPDRLNGAVKASDLIGMTVKNYQDEKLGKVEDFAVDVESGRIVQVILSTGGFIGIGDTLTAVPPGALHHDVAQKVIHLDANKEKLSTAPKFEMSKWAESSDNDHLSAVYGHYGEESAFRYVHRGDALLDGQRNPSGQRNPGIQRNTDVQRNTEAQRNRDTQRNNEGSANTVSTRNADGTWDKNRRSNESLSMIPEARLGQVQKASKLMGMSVKNLQDEKLGDVDNLLVDLAAGRVVSVIVSAGGFLGMGDELSAVPPTALRFTPERDGLQLDVSKEMLGKAPHFKADQWPDFTQPAYAGEVYRAYKVEPYFTTGRTTAADNTGRNVRDRNDRALTPLDQGNSQADRDTTAQIRKGIVAGKDMSVNAKNVKIITNQGQVTLRGPVNTAEEKRLIGVIANDIALVENVDNQLEVK